MGTGGGVGGKEDAGKGGGVGGKEDAGIKVAAAATAPERLAVEIAAMEAATHQLLAMVKGLSAPAGRRCGCGADVQALVRGILERNASAQRMRVEVAEHQARQALVRGMVDGVVHAEQTIDSLLTDLQDVEGELSRLVHRSRSLLDQSKGRPSVDTDDIVAYANHVSFTSNAGLREFDTSNRPLRPTNEWDRRFQLPYPPEYALRMEGGLFSYASSRKPVAPGQVPQDDDRTIEAASMQTTGEPEVGGAAAGRKRKAEDDADAAEGGDAKRAKGEGVAGGKGVDPAAGTPQGSAASAPATVQFSIFDDDSEDDS